VLPGIGYVILNEEQSTVTATSANLIVEAIHVHVTTANLGLAPGSDVVVAQAQSNTLVNVGLLHGFGYGTAMTAAGVLNAGRSAPVTLPCSSPGEEVNSIATVTIPGVLTTGAIQTTAQGSVTATRTSGQVTANVNSFDMLSSLVTAIAIKADANASTNGSSVSLSDSGSLFMGLAVAGHPEIGSNPGPNTRVTITGLGTLWLHRVIQSSTAIEVRMVELIVDTSYSVGLPVGADVRVAVAHAGIMNH
jgi:hypothetical protein